MDKSSTNLVFLVLTDVLQSQIDSARLSSVHKLFSGVWFHAKRILGYSTWSRGLEEKSNLCREDAEMVMGRLGIVCNSEGEMSCNEVFDEKEPSLEELKEAFDVFDENKDGFIDARELQRVLCILGLNEGSNLESCKKMIRVFDKNADGRIDLNEFVKFMENSLC